MADVETGGDERKKGGSKKVRSKKKSTRVDMTPMVDLGFLLITFFILTTTLNQPQAMDIVVPAKDDVLEDETERNKVGDEQAFTILLGKNNAIYYYEGLFDDPNKVLEPIEASWGTGENSIRKAMIRKSRERNPRYDNIEILKNQLNTGQISKATYIEKANDIKSFKLGAVVLVKASPEATYQNMVNILDEIKIANVGIYAIVDITPQEIELLEKLTGKK